MIWYLPSYPTYYLLTNLLIQPSFPTLSPHLFPSLSFSHSGLVPHPWIYSDCPALGSFPCFYLWRVLSQLWREWFHLSFRASTPVLLPQRGTFFIYSFWSRLSLLLPPTLYGIALIWDDFVGLFIYFIYLATTGI